MLVKVYGHLTHIRCVFCFRMDIDHSGRYLAQKFYKIRDPDYYEFEGLLSVYIYEATSQTVTVLLSTSAPDNSYIYICGALLRYKRHTFRKCEDIEQLSVSFTRDIYG